MVRIRLRRVGAKKQASYRVVVADQRSPRDGRFIERLGWYNPRTDPPSFKIKEDRALYWLTVGAQPTNAVARLLKKMRTNCRHSDRIVDLENLEKENKSYASMRDELDDMEKKVRRIRKLKLVRHKMKPKKKGHGLKPVKKKPKLKKAR